MSCELCFAIAVPGSSPSRCPECYLGSAPRPILPDLGVEEEELQVGTVISSFRTASQRVGALELEAFSFHLTSFGDLTAVSRVSGALAVWCSERWMSWDEYLVSVNSSASDVYEVLK